MVSEETLIVTIELPVGKDWEWYGDANVVGLSTRLDAAGRERALGELQTHWRRKCLRIVGDVPALAVVPSDNVAG